MARQESPFGPGTANAPEPVWAESLNGIAVARSVSRLDSALGSETRIRIDDDLTAASHLSASYSGEDVVLDLGGKTLSRAATTAANLLTVDNPGGSVVVKNGVLDANRQGQNFPTTKGYKELTIQNAAVARFENVRIVNNQGFSFNVVDCDDVQFVGCSVQTNPGGLGSDAAGLDGIHVFDPAQISIAGGTFVAGDDAICVHADDRSVRGVDIQGCRVSSPEHANGVRVEIRDVAAASTTIEGVNIDVMAEDCSAKGVILGNNSGNGNPIRGVSVQGTMANCNIGVGVNGVAVENASIDVTVTDAWAEAVALGAGGRNVDVRANVDGAGGSIVVMDGIENGSVSGTMDGGGTATRGIRLANCNDVAITGASVTGVADPTSVPQTGVRLEDCLHTAISGCVFTDVYRPVESFNNDGTSDYTTVTGCTGRNFTDNAVSLAGANSQAANNNFA